MLNFESLIAGESRLRTGLVEVEGFTDKVQLHELSGSEALECAREITEKDQLSQVEHINRWACRLLKGEEASDEEVEAMQQRLSNAQLVNIYMAGLKFNAIDDDGCEDIEKN